MSRGKLLHLTRAEVVARGFSQIAAIPALPPGKWPEDAGNRPIAYRVDPGFNGGFDPEAPHCASWSYGGRTPTADCVGFVLWASGIDRMRPGYDGYYGVWLNQVSIEHDANTSRVFSEPVGIKDLKPGDWGLNRGHMALVVRPATRVTPPLLIDCSPANGVSAIKARPPWAQDVRYVRPLFYKDS